MWNIDFKGKIREELYCRISRQGAEFSVQPNFDFYLFDIALIFILNAKVKLTKKLAQSCYNNCPIWAK